MNRLYSCGWRCTACVTTVRYEAEGDDPSGLTTACRRRDVDSSEHAGACHGGKRAITIFGLCEK